MSNEFVCTQQTKLSVNIFELCFSFIIIIFNVAPTVARQAQSRAQASIATRIRIRNNEIWTLELNKHNRRGNPSLYFEGGKRRVTCEVIFILKTAQTNRICQNSFMVHAAKKSDNIHGEIRYTQYQLLTRADTILYRLASRFLIRTCQ